MFFGTAALFAFSLLLGGLGPHAPLLSGLLEAAAFPLLVAVLLFGRIVLSGRTDVAVALGFVLLFVAVGAAQLIPLAPATWQALPGREIPLMVFRTIGQPNQSFPISLAPEDTRLVVQSWLPPVAIFTATLVMGQTSRARLAALVMVAAGCSVLAALVQLSFGQDALLYDFGAAVDRVPGLFANINHQALFLACSVALLPALAATRPRRSGAGRWWPAAAWLLALLGVLLTASRAGLALFAVASLVTAVRFWRRGRSDRRTSRTRAPLLAGGAALVALALVFAGGYRTDQLASRFEIVDQDARFGIWTITQDAIRTYLPVGTGFGTFEAVYQVAEPLDSVRDYYVNHAHNDYLEIALEAGVAGMILVLLFALWFAERIVHLWRARRQSDPLGWSGVMIVALVMAHSLVDYPLRTEAIGCLFAFACALLIAPIRAREEGS